MCFKQAKPNQKLRTHIRHTFDFSHFEMTNMKYQIHPIKLSFSTVINNLILQIEHKNESLIRLFPEESSRLLRLPTKIISATSERHAHSR